MPDLIARSCGRCARADDVADLARAIGEAIRLDRQACRACGEALFDVETMTDRYETLYRSTLAAAPACAEPGHLLDAVAV